MSTVKVRDLVASYSTTRVLHGVDLDATAGSWLCLVGPNGAGKSTLLRAMAGLVTYEGTVELDGRPAASLNRRDISKLVAYLPQQPVIPEDTKVFDYVSIGRNPYIPYWGMESTGDRRVVRAVLERLGLSGFSDRNLEGLSGGERQIVVLARALAQESKVLLLDEPTSALDIGHQLQVLELIDELRLEKGLTVVSALHDLTLASQFGDQLLLLNRGRVMCRGPASVVITEDHIRRNYDAEVRVVTDNCVSRAVIPVRKRASLARKDDQ